jgi:hypothetical protein
MQVVKDYLVSRCGISRQRQSVACPRLDAHRHIGRTRVEIRLDGCGIVSALAVTATEAVVVLPNEELDRRGQKTFSKWFHMTDGN